MGFEKPARAERDSSEDFPKLAQFTAEVMTAYRAEGIPVDDTGRIDVEAYRDLYTDVDADLARDADWASGWKEGGTLDTTAITDGEKLEMLASAVFMKSLGPDFAVVRAAPHDDRKNKVDTIILDRRTGDIVCAFDEVGDTTNADYQKKRDLVRDRNLRGGTELKYGLGIKQRQEDPDKGAIVLRKNEGLPIFYVALPKHLIDQGLAAFIPEQGQQSDFEKKLFEYFCQSIGMQISELELYTRRLDPQVKKNIDAFKLTVNQLNSKGTKKK